MEYTDTTLIILSIWQASYFIIEKDRVGARNIGLLWVAIHLIRMYTESQGG